MLQASKISSNVGFKKPQNRLRLSLSKGNLRNKTAHSRQTGKYLYLNLGLSFMICCPDSLTLVEVSVGLILGLG